MLNKKIFTPGPVQLHPEVLKAAVSSFSYHRSSEFKEFHGKLISKLKQIFLTGSYLHILTASGTGAMEAAVLNFCRPGGNVLFLNQGRFGARWGNICRSFGLTADELPVNYGYAVDTELLKKTDLSKYSAVFLTHSETSTATLTDISSISSYIRQNSDSLVIADAITSVCAIEFRMDDWGIDVAVSASQKGFMTQPGIALIAYSKRAYEKMIRNPMPRYYFDLRKEDESFKDKLTTWTPAVGLFYAIDKACDIVLEHGLENRWKNTHAMAEYFRTSCINEGLQLLSHNPADSLTAVKLPDNIPSGKLISNLKQNYDIQVANGQAELKDKIFRVSHMGDITIEDIKELMKIIIDEYRQLV